MHEYSVVLGLLDQVKATAAAHGASAVHRVRVTVGELSGVEPDLLRAAWDIARAGTLCAATSLELREVAAEWGCERCGATVGRGSALQCAGCATPLRLLRGSELRFDDLELEID